MVNNATDDVDDDDDNDSIGWLLLFVGAVERETAVAETGIFVGNIENSWNNCLKNSANKM